MGAAPTPDDPFATEPHAWAGSDEGRFAILRLHQQGGLGRLLIARDKELNREIALKEILPAFADSEESRRRFIREAEITGALEHPGVVPVYSLGEHGDGRPYYAMRLIRGVDLRTAIEDFHSGDGGRAEKQLAFRQLLTRFVTVCQAIDYAHHRGVIHRDLKPGNIMLGDYGETLVVDWGLAKAVDERPEKPECDTPVITPSDRAHSDRTQAGRIVGTLQYMSPEQASGRIDLLSPVSDVYGLGATLYHLITGCPPFETGNDDTVFRVQQGRFSRPREARRETPRALEAVCLKAMARKPQDRYKSAGELANDIERYLGDERVLAYAEPWSGRAWRWVRRHRGVVVTATAAAIVLVVGLTAGMALLKAQRDRAERNFALAQQAVRDYFVAVSEETLLNQPGMQPLRDVLLRQALEYYEQFLAERGDDANLRREVALAKFFVGRITETIDSPEHAIDEYEEASTIQRELLAHSNPQELASLEKELAQTLTAWGRALQNLQRTDAARLKYQEAAELRKRLAESQTHDAQAARELASTIMNLGLVDLMAGDVKAALPNLERAQSIRLAHFADSEGVGGSLQRDVGMGYYSLAQAHLTAGNGAAAETHLRSAISIFEQIAEKLPKDQGNRRRLAVCHRLLGDVEAAAGDHEAAIDSYGIAKAALEELAAQNPDVGEYSADLAGVSMNLAAQLGAIGNAKGALEEIARAVETLEWLIAGGVASPRQQCDHAVALRFYGQLLAHENRDDEARERLEASQAALQELVRAYPGTSAFAEQLKITADAIAELDSI